MAGRVTDTEKQRIIELHALGMSCNAIAKETGRSTFTVSRVAKDNGLEWASQQAAEATRVKVATNREKRATLESRFLDEAALLLDQLHQPHLVYNFGGRDNTYEEHTLTEPDVGAKRSLIQAASTAVDRAVRLAEVDKATTGADAGRHLIGNLFSALAEAAGGDKPDD